MVCAGRSIPGIFNGGEHIMTWRSELQKSVRTLEDLKKVVLLSEEEQRNIADIIERFPMLITPYYLSLIDFDDPDDPIKKIALPTVYEADSDGSLDTSGECQNTVVRGLQHKYHETALMLSTSNCAMYCRHCFRKRLVGKNDDDSVNDLAAVYEYLMAHPEVQNVLVSGGDALMNSNERIEEILSTLVKVPHLRYIRIATRVPVTLPTRVSEDAELLEILAKYNELKKLYVVTQFDHPREITPQATAAITALLKCGIPVRNQTVLLRGINDRAETLGALFSGLMSVGVEPYYVFQCRPVTGVKNTFQVPLREAYGVVEQAKATQSGLSKAFRFCMSHVTGKIEILGMLDDDSMIFKYHEAKDRSQLGEIFVREISADQAWLD